MAKVLELLILRELGLECGVTSREAGKCGPWCRHYEYEQMPIDVGKCELDGKEVRYKQLCHHNKTKQKPIYQLKK